MMAQEWAILLEQETNRRSIEAEIGRAAIALQALRVEDEPRKTARVQTIEGYQRAIAEAVRRGDEHEVERHFCRNDLFYLLVVVLGRKDANRDWIFERCAEVQAAPNGYLDLWAREHYKSTIITFAKTIQDVLENPERTIGLFSVTRPIAKAFLRQIMREFETNEALRALFPEILWTEPRRHAPKWSEDDGIIVKRLGNPKESTIEAWGLVDAQPTSKHFDLLVYDDIVTDASITSPDMIAKVTRSWETSIALGKEGGLSRYIGTRWSAADTYREIMRRGAAIERRHPITIEGTADGTPVLWSKEAVADRRRTMQTRTFSAQMLLDPSADSVTGFQESWLRFHDASGDSSRMNKYILVDPANSKKKQSDYTAMAVIGLAEDKNYYLLDAIRDRLALGDRADRLFMLHRKWQPLGVGYEQYGMSADIEFLKFRMTQTHYSFEIIALGGQLSKVDRIARMEPICRANRFYLPEDLKRIDYQGEMINITQAFIDEEYLPFPVPVHDDLFDAIARIEDEEMQVQWPMPTREGRRHAPGMRSDYRPIEDWDGARGGGRNVADGPYRPYGAG